MSSLYKQLMAAKSAPQVAPKANTTQLGTAPMNLRMAMQKYASGGGVKKAASAKQTSTALNPYDYNVGQNAKVVDIPGVGPVTTFWDEPNKRIVVSDEGYWNPNSPTGDKLKKAVDWAHEQGYQAGVVATPYASDRFGGKTTAGGYTRSMPGASDNELRNYIDAADFVVTDPYAVGKDSATPEVLQNFANFTKNIGDYAKNQGKDSWLVLQGFAPSDVDQSVIHDYNKTLINDNAGRYNDLSYFNTSDFGNETNPNESAAGLTQLDTNALNAEAVKAASPYAMAQKANIDLPTDWNNRGATDKIDWLNQHNVDPNALGQSGVGQSDIDWMTQHGYAGNTAQQPTMMVQQAQPQGVTGYNQPPPAQQQNDDFLRQFDDLMKTPTGPQLATPAAPAAPAASAAPAMPPVPPAAPAAPDYSQAYAALGGADVVNGLRNQFSQMGLDENTIGSIFSKYYGQG
jgi:hypothetical protein